MTVRTFKSEQYLIKVLTAHIGTMVYSGPDLMQRSASHRAKMNYWFRIACEEPRPMVEGDIYNTHFPNRMPRDMLEGDL